MVRVDLKEENGPELQIASYFPQYAIMMNCKRSKTGGEGG